MEIVSWPQGCVVDITEVFFYLPETAPFVPLVALGKERIFVIVQAGNRNWSLAANLCRRIDFQEAMCKGIKESSHRKKESQRYDEKSMLCHRKKLPVVAHHVNIANPKTFKLY